MECDCKHGANTLARSRFQKYTQAEAPKATQQYVITRITLKPRVKNDLQVSTNWIPNEC